MPGMAIAKGPRKSLSAIAYTVLTQAFFSASLRPRSPPDLVVCVKSCKLIMGSGKAIPAEPPSLFPKH